MKPVSATNKKRGPGKSATRLAAEGAGLSRHQMYQAMQVASMPEDVFEAQVESDNPPSVSELASIASGKTHGRPVRRLRCCPHCGGSLERKEGK